MNSEKIWEDSDFSVSLHEFRTVMSHFFITKAPCACGTEVKDSLTVYYYCQGSLQGLSFFCVQTIW